VAPGNPNVGVMLPYTPLHHLLLAACAGPLVATSGNLSDEPICIDEHEAIARLAMIADYFLVHDRPIVRHVDDSVVRVMLDRELLLRRARGYAPLPIPLPAAAVPTIAVGGHMKNTVAVSAGNNAFISQHIGDLDTPPSLDAFRAVLSSVRALYRTTPETVVADLHPDYASTKYAHGLGLPVLHVQHHFAHIAACMADNELEGPVLGVAWDGTGYGTDGTIWGGEFLLVEGGSFARVGCLRPFPLPGGERAAVRNRRS
jgi:hydrogenase maturation protein HypF